MVRMSRRVRRQTVTPRGSLGMDTEYSQGRVSVSGTRQLQGWGGVSRTGGVRAATVMAGRSGALPQRVRCVTDSRVVIPTVATD
ncbi:hypothetical protein GCM10010372_13990 [Streptomyces tauricus]|nr:hypothetical protein GCM10010372_13990 [Streptomyces tauricus]